MSVGSVVIGIASEGPISQLWRRGVSTTAVETALATSRCAFVIEIVLVPGSLPIVSGTLGSELHNFSMAVFAASGHGRSS